MSLPGPVRTIAQPRTFTHRAAEQIRELILSGRIAAGDRINEVELAQQFGISRSPLREALNALASEKLLVLIPGKGAFVPEYDIEAVRHLGETRVALECTAVKQAAVHASDDDVAEMSASLHEAGAQLQGHCGGYPAGTDLHQLILRACTNTVIEELASSVNARLRLARLVSGHNPSRAREAHHEHIRIVEALQRRDVDAAGAAMADHLKVATASALKEMAGVARETARP